MATNNQEALGKAICAGEVMVTQRNGMDYCCYPKFKHTTKQGTEDKGILKADTQLEQNQFALLSAAFNKIGHGSEEKTGRQESSSSHKSPPKKALPQKPDWSTLKPLLGEAKSAIDRLEGDLMKTRERVQGSKDDNLVSSWWSTTRSAKEMLTMCSPGKNSHDSVRSHGLWSL